MIAPNALAEIHLITGTRLDAVGEPVHTVKIVSIVGLFSWGTSTTSFGVDRDILNEQATFTTFAEVESDRIKSVIINGKPFVLDGIPTRWESPPNFRLKTGIILNLKRSLNG